MSSYPEEYRERRPDGDAARSPRELEERRQRALDRLTEAFASDLVTMESYEGRVAAIQAARDREALDGLVADLPEAAPKRPERQAVRPAGGRAEREPAAARQASALANRIEPGLSGSESVACVMGDRHLQGDWLQGDKVDSFTLMGSVKYDFRDTALPPGRIKIDAFCLMGDVKVIVPRGLPVKMSAFPFMADARVGREVERRIVPGEPYLDISGFVMMGDIQVSAAD